MELRFSIHESIRGKPLKDSGFNLGYGWLTIDATWEDAFNLITVDGCATSSALNSDNRKEATFESRQIVMVDIDDGMSILDLFDNEFYNAYGAGFYSTPSFTPEKHKFRICFVLDYAEKDAARLRRITRGLLRVYEQADEACKDPTRIFYGNPNCTIKESTNRLLPRDIADYLISIIDAEEEEQLAAMQHTPRVDYEMTDERKKKILDLLSTIYLGNYQLWRNVGWGLRAGGFTLQDYQYVTQFLMSKKTPSDAAAVWRAGRDDGAITMGSVIHLLKTHLGAECMKEVAPITPLVEYFNLSKSIKEKYNL